MRILRALLLRSSLAPAGGACPRRWTRFTPACRRRMRAPCCSDVARAQTEYRAAHGRYTASLRALGRGARPDVDVRIRAEGAAGVRRRGAGAGWRSAPSFTAARRRRGSYARIAGRIACRAR